MSKKRKQRKPKKPRSAAQKAATARMLAGAKKKGKGKRGRPPGTGKHQIAAAARVTKKGKTTTRPAKRGGYVGKKYKREKAKAAGTTVREKDSRRGLASTRDRVSSSTSGINAMGF